MRAKCRSPRAGTLHTSRRRKRGKSHDVSIRYALCCAVHWLLHADLLSDRGGGADHPNDQPKREREEVGMRLKSNAPLDLGSWEKRKSCIGCQYYRPLSTSEKQYVCHYCIDIGEPRGCPADQCDKKVIGKHKYDGHSFMVPIGERADKPKPKKK